MLAFKRKSTHSVLIPADSKTVMIGFSGYVLHSDIQDWLNQNIGREAITLSDLSRATNGEAWYCSGAGTNADGHKVIAIHFNDRAKAALFKLTWS